MRKGFTLIELIFVIVVLSILSAVAVPKLAGEKLKGTDLEVIAKIGKEVRKELDKQSKKPEQENSSDGMQTVSESDYIRGQ